MAETAKKRRAIQVEIITQVLTLATSGFGLVAALAWNNVIQSLVNDYIKNFLPKNYGIISLLIYALIVTILAVVITWNLAAIKERLDR